MRLRLFISILLLTFTSCQSKKTELKVLQFNIWQEGTVVENGFNGIVDNIANLEPDMITFSEVRNYANEDFIEKLVWALKQKGLEYYGKSSISSGILSKYPILKQEVIYPLNNDRGSVTKAEIKVKNQTILLYSAHLDYTHYACYLPRGYSGVTWEKLDAPVTDTCAIEQANLESMRDEAIRSVLEDTEKEASPLILLGGDFNEPSHLDWQENTRHLWDHNGVIVRWPCSLLLEQHGFKDTYRERFPNPVTHPGFTFPSDNPLVEVQKLTWAPEADERERIDFIYYRTDKRMKLIDAAVVGPRASIVRNKRVTESSEDHFIAPVHPWPTDHKAVWATFELTTD